ncbi:three-Cys-motif partner protein TcmP [Pontibacter ruber]|uniref:Three-Cys-motif partner protein TcmP n=1 Tax=Pontibacter ruber TaxID=1343895 RepID=A0ABW5D0W2_9BACT|nr:three-Cys-motif partner protein TcmP [Pontibacter ruber]
MPAAVPKDFFKEHCSFAEIKDEVIGNFLADWCGILPPLPETDDEQAILYIDLNSGAGLVPSGLATLPDNLLENLCQALSNNKGANALLRAFFADANKTVHESIGEKLASLPCYDNLVHPPVALAEQVSQTMLAELQALGYPSLLLGDPFSSVLAQQVLQQSLDAGNADLLLLFSPESMLKALSAKKVSPALASLFGERLVQIASFCKKEKNTRRRQQYIAEQLESILLERKLLTLTFKINKPDADETAYYLLFSSQNKKAFKRFRELMLSYSDYHEDGVPMFTANHALQPQLSLFPQRRRYSVSLLAEDLATSAGKYKFKSIEKISEDHSSGTPYIADNYLAAFEVLRVQGKVEILNPKTLQAIRKPTLASIIKYK